MYSSIAWHLVLCDLCYWPELWSWSDLCPYTMTFDLAWTLTLLDIRICFSLWNCLTFCKAFNLTWPLNCLNFGPFSEILKSTNIANFQWKSYILSCLTFKNCLNFGPFSEILKSTNIANFLWKSYILLTLSSLFSKEPSNQ